MLVSKETIIYFLYITLSVIILSLIWLFFSPPQHTAIFFPFIGCLSALIGFAFAHLHLFGASIFSSFKWYRRWLKGQWHYYSFTGQLPGLFGGMWTRDALKPHRHYKWTKSEYYSIGYKRSK